MNNILETKNLKVTINNKVILYLDKEVCISEKRQSCHSRRQWSWENHVSK